jgi:hypothetical protein
VLEFGGNPGLGCDREGAWGLEGGGKLGNAGFPGVVFCCEAAEGKDVKGLGGGLPELKGGKVGKPGEFAELPLGVGFCCEGTEGKEGNGLGGGPPEGGVKKVGNTPPPLGALEFWEGGLGRLGKVGKGEG